MWVATIIVMLLVGTNEMRDPIDMLSAKDRALQAQAVETLASNCGDCVPGLLNLWRTTNRFDVHVQIAKVFEKLGPEGIPPLLELTRDVRVLNDHGMASLVIMSLSKSGPDVMNFVYAEIERPDSHIGVILHKLCDRLGLDPLELTYRLLQSKASRTREAALRFAGILPLPERTRMLVDAAQDTDEKIRASARWGLPVWSVADQQQFPNDFEKYSQSLCKLLGSNDPTIRTSSARTLKQNRVKNPEAAEALATIIRETSRKGKSSTSASTSQYAESFWLRQESMAAYLVVHPETGAAIRTLMEELDFSPFEVSTALWYVDPEQIPKEDLKRIVMALPQARGREETPAEALLVRVGAPAVPHLIDALGGDDATLSGHAAGALAKMADSAKPAIPMLIEQLKTRGKSWQGYAYVSALIKIDSEDQSVHDAMTLLITDDSSDVYVAGNALRDLIARKGNEEWVQKIAAAALLSPSHRLHKFAYHYPPPAIANLVAANEERLIRDIIDTSARDEAWSYATGRIAKEVDIVLVQEERDRRVRAAQAVAIIEDPQDATIEALILGLQSQIIILPQPPGYGEYPQGDRRNAIKRALWEFERTVAAEMARSLSKHAYRNPAVLRKTIEMLHLDHFALALVLSHPIEQPSKPGHYVYLSVPSELADRAFDALNPFARELTPFHARQGWIITAIGRLPRNYPKKLETLLDLIYFGEGKDGPSAALISIGFVRPITPEILDIIRSHLEDPRGATAAIAAAANAEEHATVLLDDLLERGRRHMRYSTGSEVAAAVTKIAPSDPRVQNYLADHRARMEDRLREKQK